MLLMVNHIILLSHLGWLYLIVTSFGLRIFKLYLRLKRFLFLVLLQNIVSVRTIVIITAPAYINVSEMLKSNRTAEPVMFSLTRIFRRLTQFRVVRQYRRLVTRISYQILRWKPLICVFHRGLLFTKTLIYKNCLRLLKISSVFKN